MATAHLVEEWRGGRYSAVATSTEDDVLDRLTGEQLRQLDELIDGACEQLRQLGVLDPEAFLHGEVVRRKTDAEAYQREAARRGVLPL